MTDQETSLVLHRLDDLLEAERTALLSGNLDAIAALVDQKETLITQLVQADVSDDELLATIAHKTKRNQGLLDEALNGIRNVATRLSEFRRVRRSLDTYDSNGAKQSVEIPKTGSFEKRA